MKHSWAALLRVVMVSSPWMRWFAAGGCCLACFEIMQQSPRSTFKLQTNRFDAGCVFYAAASRPNTRRASLSRLGLASVDLG